MQYVSFLNPNPISSLINWLNTHTVFNLSNQENNITPKIPNRYDDENVNEKVPLNYFDSIFHSIDSFQPLEFHNTFKIIPTDMGQEGALVKEWISQDSKLQFWITNDGWAVIYGAPTTFLIIGNFVSHPFVMTPLFSFDNSDGSTNEDIDLPVLNLIQVKYLLKTKVPEYIFNQVH